LIEVLGVWESLVFIASSIAVFLITWARVFAVLVVSALGAFTDWKKGEIYHWITFPLIIIGVGMNVYEAQYIAFGLAGIVFAIGYILYKTGKLGGGDVMLFTGIALTVPFFGGHPFILNVLVIAAATSVVFLSVYYVSRYIRKGIDWEYNKKNLSRAGILGIILLLYFILLSQIQGVGIIRMLPIIIPLVFGIVYVAFEAGIKKEFFTKKIKVSELEEDEIISEENLDPKIYSLLNLKFIKVIGEKEKEILKENNVKEIWVYRNLPKFGPFIFLGVVISLLYPDVLLGIFMV